MSTKFPLNLDFRLLLTASTLTHRVQLFRLRLLLQVTLQFKKTANVHLSRVLTTLDALGLSYCRDLSTARWPMADNPQSTMHKNAQLATHVYLYFEYYISAVVASALHFSGYITYCTGSCE